MTTSFDKKHNIIEDEDSNLVEGGSSPKELPRRTGSPSNDDSSSITWYLQQTNKIDLLSREEEDRLARLARDGDESAKNQLIKANLRFVVSIAKRYQASGISLLDLINEGNMGLMKAAEKFDPDQGCHFISYAVHWIRQAIMTAISQKTSLIHIPSNKKADLQKIEQVHRILENKFGRQPTAMELAEELAMENEEINHLRSVGKDHLSLDIKYGDSEDATILSMLADHKEDSPEKQLLEEALSDALNSVMETLTEPEKQVIQMRYGLNGQKPMTLQEIGAEFNLSKERVRQIEKKAIRRMRDPSRSQTLKIFLQD